MKTHYPLPTNIATSFPIASQFLLWWASVQKQVSNSQVCFPEIRISKSLELISNGYTIPASYSILYETIALADEKYMKSPELLDNYGDKSIF